ncbi:isocitrate lyase/PEP mutase family protein [Pollutimonas bauzanensis]|uniref:Phosphoenolpyruvate phosphomutase n=1 Tax=Pollutimonas bauzanensis TaxID=658167 RepID=A0A1M5V4P6_9BURK|nr:isocitrate lyase/PEP mutase family protein [Pollutimonas bauzanensis]SHH70128.1 Phosphoenolpyruvate phosphomutase [Pollutimonas bauzanensis]
MASTRPGTILQQKVQARRGLMVAGASNALTARLIQQLGFEAVYLTGAGITNTFYGVPDLGFISLADLAQHTAATRDAVDLPIIVDADTGFGNALNVRHTVRTLERAGANAIQLEDQVMPKKCGHFSGKAVIPAAEAASKIKAAVDARANEDFLIIARTDARAVEGFEAALERAALFAENGADITFVEAPESLDELRRIPQALRVPQVVNVVIGGKTPTLPAAEFATMGFGLVLYANAALQSAVHGMTVALERLRDTGRLDEDSGLVASFAQRQQLVQKGLFDDLDKRYSV